MYFRKNRDLGNFFQQKAKEVYSKRKIFGAVLLLALLFGAALFLVDSTSNSLPENPAEPFSPTDSSKARVLDNALGVYPSFIEGDTSLGDTSSSFDVINTTSNNIEVDLSFNPYQYGGDELKQTREDFSNGEEALIRFSSSTFSLPAMSSKKINIEPLRYPEIGLDIYGAIAVRGDLPKGEKSQFGKAEITPEPRSLVEVPMILSLPGEQETDFNIRRLALESKPSGDVQPWMQIENNGNYTIDPRGAFALYSLGGEIIQKTSTTGNGLVFPSSSNWISSNQFWENINPGEYILQGEVFSEEAEETKIERIVLSKRQVGTLEARRGPKIKIDFISKASNNQVVSNIFLENSGKRKERVTLRGSLVYKNKPLVQDTVSAVLEPESIRESVFTFVLDQKTKELIDNAGLGNLSVRLEALSAGDLLYELVRPVEEKENAPGRENQGLSLGLLFAIGIAIASLVALVFLGLVVFLEKRKLEKNNL